MISPNGYFTIQAILHESYVLFIIFNILFNYFACVTTRNFPGTKYENVVRELADATGFDYPDTVEGHEHWKMQFHQQLTGQRLVLRDINMERHRPFAKDSNDGTNSTNINNSTSGNDCQKPCYGDNGTISQVGNDTCSSRDIPMGYSSSSQINNESTTTMKPQIISNTNNLIQPSLLQSPRSSPLSITTPTPPQNLSREYVRTIIGPHDWSYCTRSRLAKPPRSHFDQVTRGLILNMDHFCPWMFNVGKWSTLSV